ncbi:hypothetical protein MKC70_17660 [[Clostridium] innocuum]|nr:hypothetical protein [[Clostridium] innocuum]
MLTALTGPLRYRKAGERKRRSTWKELPTICDPYYTIWQLHTALYSAVKKESGLKFS